MGECVLGVAFCMVMEEAEACASEVVESRGELSTRQSGTSFGHGWSGVRQQEAVDQSSDLVSLAVSQGQVRGGQLVRWA